MLTGDIRPAALACAVSPTLPCTWMVEPGENLAIQDAAPAGCHSADASTPNTYQRSTVDNLAIR